MNRLVMIGMAALLDLAISVGAEASPATSLYRTVHARASRDYGFREKAWMGPIPDWGKKPDAKTPF